MGGDAPAFEELRKANLSLLGGIRDAEIEVDKAYGKGTGQLLEQYTQSRTDLTTYLGQAISDGNQWASAGLEAYEQMNQANTDPMAGLTTYLNSADYRLFYGGEGGAGGDPNQSALERFKESPDYQYRLNQSLDAINRRASVGGYLNDPRLSQELMAQGGEMASQEWGAYNDRLAANYNAYNSRLASTAQIGFQAMQGNQQIQGQLGTGLASLSQAYGQNLSDWSRWQGEQHANAKLARGNADAQYRLVRAAMFAPSSSAAVQGWMAKT